MTDQPDNDEDQIIDMEHMDPSSIEEIQEIKARVEEWQAVHGILKKHEDEPTYSFRRVTYEDDSEDVVVVCDTCGEGECIAVREKVGDEFEWSIIWSGGLN